MTITRSVAAALAAAALVAPAAQAKPADVHLSVAEAAAKARQQQERQPAQDIRSPDARDAALHPRSPGEAFDAPPAVDSATPPARPQPIARVADGGTSVDPATMGLGVAAGLAVGGLTVLGSRHRSKRLRVSG